MKTTIEIEQKRKHLMVRGTVNPAVDEIEVRIASSRNESIAKFTDRSPHDINSTDRYQDIPKEPYPDRQIWWPIVDVKLRDEMFATAIFSGDESKQGSYCVNGMFHEETHPLQNHSVIQREQLEHWENAFYVSGCKSVLTNFYLSCPVNVSEGEFELEISLLTEQWNGRISLHLPTEGGRELAADEVFVEASTVAAANPEESLVYKELNQEQQSLIEALDYVLRSQNLDQRSAAFGGLFLFYDHDARTFRQSAWIWPWGAAIRLLIDAADLPFVASIFGKNTLYDAAKKIGEATLRFQIQDQSHPGDGLIVCRHDPNIRFSNGGHTGMISPADTLFLAGWGWAPLYELTNDERYLQAMENAMHATERIMAEDVIIKQDFLTKEQFWVDHTLDESGFGMEGMAELFRLNGDHACKRIGSAYINQMIACLERSDGLWERDWTRANKGPSTTYCNTRGMGWAMEGLLAAHRLLPDGPYLNKAKRMAEHLLAQQLEDGSWSFEFDKTPDFLGISEKGTALWSMLLYKFYALTGDDKHRSSARKALEWCMSQQYEGENADGRGGIIGCTPASGVIYRPFFRMSCVYTSAFMGLALLEELRNMDE